MLLKVTSLAFEKFFRSTFKNKKKLASGQSLGLCMRASVVAVITLSLDFLN